MIGYSRIALVGLMVLLFPRGAKAQLVDPFSDGTIQEVGGLVDPFTETTTKSAALVDPFGEDGSEELKERQPGTVSTLSREWIGTFVTESQSHVRPKQNQSRCDVVTEKRLAIQVDPVGFVTWTGFQYMNMKCPGANPEPSSCWYEGNGHAEQTSENELRLETVRTSLAGPAIGNLNVWKCGVLEVVLPRSVQPDKRDCTLLGPRESSGSAKTRALLCERSPAFAELTSGRIRSRGQSFVLQQPSQPKSLTLRKLRATVVETTRGQPVAKTLAEACADSFQGLSAARRTLDDSRRNRRLAIAADDYMLKEKATASRRDAEQAISNLETSVQRCPNKPTRTEEVKAYCARVDRGWQITSRRLNEQKQAKATATRTRNYGAERLSGRYIRSLQEELSDSQKLAGLCRALKTPRTLTGRKVPTNVPESCNETLAELQGAWRDLTRIGIEISESEILKEAGSMQAQRGEAARYGSLVRQFSAVGELESETWRAFLECTQ